MATVRGYSGDGQRGLRVTPVTVRSYAQEGKKLDRLRELVEQGALTLRVADTYPAEQAVEAHRRLEAGGTRTIRPPVLTHARSTFCSQGQPATSALTPARESRPAAPPDGGGDCRTSLCGVPVGPGILLWVLVEVAVGVGVGESDVDLGGQVVEFEGLLEAAECLVGEVGAQRGPVAGFVGGDVEAQPGRGR